VCPFAVRFVQRGSKCVLTADRSRCEKPFETLFEQRSRRKRRCVAVHKPFQNVVELQRGKEWSATFCKNKGRMDECVSLLPCVACVSIDSMCTNTIYELLI
jgi:hypothetical protein